MNRFASGILAAAVFIGAMGGARADSPACGLCFYGPDNMVFDRSGDMYVTDSDHDRRSRIVRLTPAGRMTWQWRRFAYRAGARNGPEGIALAVDGSIVVTDGPSRVLIVASSGKSAKLLGNGTVHFSDLGHVAVNTAGDTYVAEAGPNRIYKFDRDGRLAAVWHRPKGSGANDWSGPETIALQPDGNLVVEDWANRRIEIFLPSGVMARSFGSPGTAPGHFRSTAGLAVDRHGDMYVADIGLHRVQEFDPRGRFVAMIGNDARHTLFTANGPSAVAVDKDGNLYSPDGTSIIKYTRLGRVLARWR